MAKMRQQKKPDYLKQLLAALEADTPERIRAIFSDRHPADIADLIESVPAEQRPIVWAQVDADRQGETLLELTDPVRADLVAVMDDHALAAATRTLDTDDIADLIPELSDEAISEILLALDRQDRQRLDTVLPYPEDTAGGLMNVDTVTVRENISLEVVLRYLRRRNKLPENTDALFVVDRNDRLIGQLLISRLLISDPEQRVTEVMDRKLINFNALTPEQEVAEAFANYDLVSAPVVDENNRLLGRITVDDVVDVMRAEAGRSLMAQAGLPEDEDVLAPVFRSSRHRALWLGINLLTAVMASWVIGLFERTIEQAVALAVLMPIVASMGGNAGIQTLTLVVRGLALGTIETSNARRVLIKELLVGSVNGMLWAFAVAIVAILWYDSLTLGLVIAMAMAINLAFAALSGVIIPILVHKMGVDPMLASGVILTTVTDVVGFFAFLGLATVFLI